MLLIHKSLHILYSSIEGFACNLEGRYNIIVYMKSGAVHDLPFKSREEQRETLDKLKENVGKQDPQ